MIPEQYWVILRRWFWLIAMVGVAGAALALVVVPKIRGDVNPGHSAAVTLGVTRLVSSDGTVSTIGGAAANDLLASYTNSIAARGNTPQFVKELSDRLAQQGLVIDQTALARKITFTADPGLFRVSVSVKSANASDAELIDQTASQLMIDDVTSEEARITGDLAANFDKQKQTLTDNLNKVYADRTAELATIGEPAVTQAMNDLIARGASSDSVATFQTLIADLARINSDPQLAILNSEAQTLEKQIGDLSATQNSFSEDSLGGTPIAVLDPVNTVELPAVDGLRTRDMLLMGGIAGLVVGWLLASALNGAVFSRRDRRKVAASKWEPAKVGGGDG